MGRNIYRMLPRVTFALLRCACRWTMNCKPPRGNRPAHSTIAEVIAAPDLASQQIVRFLNHCFRYTIYEACVLSLHLSAGHLCVSGL